MTGLLVQSLAMAGPAWADDQFSASDKQTIVQGFLSRAARLDAGDIHAHLTGVMGLVSENRDSPSLDFSLSGRNVGGKAGADPFTASEPANTVENQPSDDTSTGNSDERPSTWSSDSNYGGESKHEGSHGNHHFADTAPAYEPVSLRPTDLLFGRRQPAVEREAAYDLESARFALAGQLSGDAAEVLRKPMRFNFWLASKGTNEIGDRYDPGGDRRSDSWALTTGAHYKITPKTLFGALFRARSTTGSAPGLSASTELESYGVGLYGGWALTDNITLSALGVYERGDNAATIDGAWGRYGSDQLSLSGNLKGYWRYGNWWLAPSASLTWTRTSSDAYLDSSGDAIGAGLTETAQATFGPQIGYVFFGDDWVKAIRPRLAVTGIYSFLDTGTQQLSGGTIPGTKGFYGQALAGVDIWLNNRMTMNLDAGYDGIGTKDLEAWTVRGKVSIPFR